MKNLYIMRHAQTVFNLEEKFQGMTDSELTPDGIRKTHEIALYLEDKRLNMIYSSPLPRCIKTAEIISHDLSVNLEVQPILAEISFGSWEGKQKHTEIKDDELNFKKRDRFNFKHPGSFMDYEGGSYKDLYERLIPFWDKLFASNLLNILVVAHLGVMIAAKKYFLHLSDEEAGFYSPSNNTIIHFLKGKQAEFKETKV